MIASGERCLIIAMKVLQNLQEKGLDFDVVNARFVKPLDTELLGGLTSEYIVTIEDNVFLGGLGAMIDGAIMQSGKACKVKNFAYRDEFIPQGKICDLQSEYGVNCKDVEAYIRKVLQ